MRYFNDPSEAEITSNPLVSDIDLAVKSARSNEEWRHDYLTWQMYGNEKYIEGKEEGRVGGLEEGLEKGRSEGRIENQREIIERLLLREKYDLDEISEMIGVSLDVVKEIEAAMNVDK